MSFKRPSSTRTLERPLEGQSFTRPSSTRGFKLGGTRTMSMGGPHAPRGPEEYRYTLTEEGLLRFVDFAYAYGLSEEADLGMELETSRSLTQESILQSQQVVLLKMTQEEVNPVAENAFGWTLLQEGVLRSTGREVTYPNALETEQHMGESSVAFIETSHSLVHEGDLGLAVVPGYKIKSVEEQITTFSFLGIPIVTTVLYNNVATTVGTAGTSVVQSATFAIPPGVVVMVPVAGGNNIASTAVTLSGHGLTWTRVRGGVEDANGKILVLFQAHATAATTGRVVATIPGGVWAFGAAAVQCIGLSGLTSSPVVQSAQTTGAGGAGTSNTTVSLAAFSNTSNVAFGSIMNFMGSTNHTPGAGFTEIAEFHSTLAVATVQSQISNLATTNIVWTTTTPAVKVALGVELQRLA